MSPAGVRDHVVHLGLNEAALPIIVGIPLCLPNTCKDVFNPNVTTMLYESRVRYHVVYLVLN